MLVFFESSKVLVSIGNKISEMHTGKKEQLRLDVIYNIPTLLACM